MVKRFCDKYNPKTLSEVVGNKVAIESLKRFIQDFKRQRKKAVILYGQTGTGKTCSVYAIANELGLEILEVNASDKRNKGQIEDLIGNAVKQQSLFNKGKIILIDEVEGITGREDRGGIPALIRIIAKTQFPIVMTCNDPFSQKLSSLRRKVNLIEFKGIDHKEIFNYLKEICKKEEIKSDENALKQLARKVSGDLRAALSDLENLSEGKKSISVKDLDLSGDRERKEEISNALKLIFKSKDVKLVLNAFSKTDLDLDECFLWLDENIPKEYSGDDLKRAYEAISRADVFRGRIRRWQYYRFLVYQNLLMSAGVALAKEKKNKEIVNYDRTKRILKLWLAKQKYAKRKAIAEKIALATHTSTRRAIKDSLPYFKVMFQNNHYDNVINELDLNEEEISWLEQ